MPIPKLPVGIEPVNLTRTKIDMPVTCGGCDQPFRPAELRSYHGRRLCSECLNLAERSRKTESLLIVVKEILTRKIDAAGRIAGTEGTIELNTARKAFLSEIGGETTFGTMWAQLVRHVHDRAVTENKNANVAAKMFCDVAKFLEAAKDREVAGFARMTLEQMKEQQALTLASYMRDTAVAEAMQRMIELVEATAMGGGDMDELIEKFDRVLTTPVPAPRLTEQQSAPSNQSA
jgi:hypothetical protein